MDAVKVGEKIATLRKEKGMTQVELAEKLHVTNRAVSKWENGLNFPDLSLMEPLAETLGVTVSELLGLEGKTKEEVFQMTADISEKEKKIIRKRIRDGTFGIILYGCILCIYAIVLTIRPDNIFFDEAGLKVLVLPYSAAMVIWGIRIILNFRKWNKV